MTTANLLNSVGLVLDIVGAVLLWRYGLPEALSRSGAIYMILEQNDPAEAAKAKWYDRLANWGMLLLVVGFALQLASNFVWRW
jgi:hypothetical protein